MTLMILTAMRVFLKFCEDYEVLHDPMKYRDENFSWTYQRGIKWPDDYIGPESMTGWIIEKSQGFTDIGLLNRIQARGHIVTPTSLQVFS